NFKLALTKSHKAHKSLCDWWHLLSGQCALCLIMFNGAYLFNSVQPLVFRGFIIEVSRNE
ncbi:hypothetical protein, partial [Vibrio cyclitrophicus]|uniref:hypothetical protein n=1 Tax=Vibrio cyclitrophicus TaxID=47951 RepID=UPI001C978262